MGSISITESELQHLILEELDAMIENGEIDEGVMDAIRKVGRGVTQVKGAVKGGLSQVGSAASSLKKRGVSAALGAVGEKDAAAAMAADAEDTAAQGAQKAQMAKAKAVLGKSYQTLGGAYEDLAKNAQALGLFDTPEVKTSLAQLQTAIGNVSQTITKMTTPQAAGAAPEAGTTPPQERIQPGAPGSTTAALLKQQQHHDNLAAQRGDKGAQQKVAQRKAQEEDWIKRGKPMQAGVPQYRLPRDIKGAAQ